MPRYIDAEALKAKYEQMLPEIGDGYHKETLQDVLFELEYAPTISPDEFRGVGKWEDVSVHDNIRNIMIASMRCNVCKRYHNEVYHYGNPTEMARFCPVCGAKMEVRA